jgi:hypothetical protein
MDNFLDTIMSLGFKYSEPIFRLVYDKLYRQDLYHKITTSQPKDLLKEDPSVYTNIKWLSKNDLDSLTLEDPDDIIKLKELTYLKQSIRFFKIYSIFLAFNTALLLLLIVGKGKFKHNEKAKNWLTRTGVFVILGETPYLVINYLAQEDKDYLTKVNSKEIEKYKVFYKI